MKRFIYATLSLLAVAATFSPVSTIVAAKPPSGDLNPSDRGNTTVDTSQVIAAKPPSGDLNPSDRGNTTVDTSQVIG